MTLDLIEGTVEALSYCLKAVSDCIYFKFKITFDI